MTDSVEWDAQLAAYEGTPISEASPTAPTTADTAHAPVDVQVPVETQSEPSPVAPAVEAPQLPVATHEYLLPDDPDLPPSMKGKTVGDLLRERRDAITQAVEAARMRNEMERRLQVNEAIVQTLQQRMAPPAAPAPQRPAFAEQMRQRGVNPETDLIDRAPDVLRATADYAVEETQQRLNETLQQYEARVRQLEQIQVASQAERAFQTARPATIPQEEWNRKAYAIASFIKGNGWEQHIADPNVHVAAYRMLYGEPPPAAPAQQPAPVSAPAAKPAAPPVGAKPSATSTAAPKKQFKDSERGTYREMYQKAFGSLDGFEDLENDVLSNPDKWRIR